MRTSQFTREFIVTFAARLPSAGHAGSALIAPIMTCVTRVIRSIAVVVVVAESIIPHRTHLSTIRVP